MHPRIDQLVQTLLQKESIEQCSLEELINYASRYPYFGAAQLLLTKKMQALGLPEYQEQLDKTYVYFRNPLWVRSIMEEKGTVSIEHAAVTVVENFIPSEPITAIPEEKENSPTPVVKDELLFEPYHTVDYFASQGIKLKEEPKPTDKFGQQLLSFTEWLKTLRKMGPTEAGSAVPVLAEKKVEELAENSLTEKQVLTEAMAEVWEKQGNPSKAIEIYQKLSLLEPGKIAYFAAKIEALKN